MTTLIGDFSGDELVVTWTRNPANDNNDVLFHKFECDFVVNDVVERTVSSFDEDNPRAVYRFNDMVKDQGTTSPSRTISVRVREIDAYQNASANALGTFTNERPPAPLFKAEPFFGSVLIRITPVEDQDLAGYMIFRGSSAGFTPSTGNRIYKGTDTSFTDNDVLASTTYYYKVLAYDRFGSSLANWNVTSAIGTQAQFVPEVPDWNVVGVVFTPNSPATNRIAWTSGTVYRTVEGVSVAKSVASGNLATASTATRFIYFDWADGLVKNTTSLTEAMQFDHHPLGTYKGGTNWINGVNEVQIDGSRIIAATIGAQQIVTGSAVITGTAQIANAVITGANIDDATIKTAHIFGGSITNTLIANSTITGSKIVGGTITNALISNNTITGNKIVGGTIEGSHMANSTITASKIVGGTITDALLANNTITASKIKGGTITGALIANSTITGGKIGDYAVDTLNMTLNSIGRTYLASSTTVRNLSRDVEYEVTKFTIPTGIEGKLLITGVWYWESDDNPGVRYRIMKNGSQLSKFDGKNYGTRDTSFTMSAATSVVPGDVISLRLTRTTSGGVSTRFGQLCGLLTRR